MFSILKKLLLKRRGVIDYMGDEVLYQKLPDNVIPEFDELEFGSSEYIIISKYLKFYLDCKSSYINDSDSKFINTNTFECIDPAFHPNFSRKIIFKDPKVDSRVINVHLHIYKSFDEWYIVTLNGKNRIKFCWTLCTYKCDGLDGLKQLIKGYSLKF